MVGKIYFEPCMEKKKWLARKLQRIWLYTSSRLYWLLLYLANLWSSSNQYLIYNSLTGSSILVSSLSYWYNRAYCCTVILPYCLLFFYIFWNCVTIRTYFTWTIGTSNKTSILKVPMSVTTSRYGYLCCHRHPSKIHSILQGRAK
jgi:hypothetical protein